MSTLRERILAESNGKFMLDRYLLNKHVVAVTCEPDEADTCMIGESHQDTTEHICLRRVQLEDEIVEGARILMITKKTWDKSLTQNLLKAKLDEYKQRKQG